MTITPKDVRDAYCIGACLGIIFACILNCVFAYLSRKRMNAKLERASMEQLRALKELDLL